MKKKLAYIHSGALGDIVYSLFFCLEYAKIHACEQFTYIIQTNVPFQHGNDHPAGAILTNGVMANFLKPLLESQSYIQEVLIVDYHSWPENIDTHTYIFFSLDYFRTLPLNYSANYIPNYYYALTHLILPKNFHTSVLKVVPDIRAHNKIILFRSSRYQNARICYNFLEKYSKNILFIGLPNEYEAFVNQYFSCQFLPIINAQEAAELIAGAVLTIGNQTSLFAIAEALKTPRFLEQCPTIPNVLTIGGLGKEFIFQSHFEKMIEFNLKTS